MAGDGLLLDVADAVASSQRVDWDRARSAARPEEHRSLGNLRALSGMFAAVGRGTPGRAGAAASGDRPGTALARAALRVMVALAALHAVTALAILLLSWEHALEQPFSAPRVLALLSLSVCALLLLAGGRRDHRAGLLGAAFMLGASSFSIPLLVGYVGEVAGWILPEVFLPALLWAFAGEFPRVHRRSRIDGLVRRMVPFCVCIGGAFWIANLPPLRASLAFLERRSADGVYWIPLAFLTLSAVVAVAWRARDATAEETRRVMLLIGGLVIGVAPMCMDIVIESLWPVARRYGDANRDVVATVVFTFLLSTPWSVTWAVLAERALDIRMVVRASYRRLLTRRLLTAAIAAPLGTLGWLFLSQADRTVADVAASSPVRLLVPAAVAAALAAACRRRLLVRLDAWVYPETADHRRVLAVAGSELVEATAVSHVGDAVAGSMRRGCGVPTALLVTAENGPYHPALPVAAVPPLARTSAIAHVLEFTHKPLHVDPDDRASVFALLPGRDAEWVVEAAAATVVPVFGPASEVVGLAAIGRRFDDRRLSAVDLDFLQALAVTAGLALARLGSAGAGPDAPPARECPACGIVAAPDSAQRCGCDVQYVAASVPRMLAGKFLVEQRIGSGGMGVVYLARDVGLQRHVAVKTVPAALGGVLRLRQEARAMAAVMHPAIAQIHGVETWRGLSVFVMEFLAGGTLAMRLERGPLPGPEAVRVALALAAALAAVHDAGYTHGDLKPSNVGFTAGGSPKLLDFGLARLMDDRDQPAGGTLSYMSPEAVRGGQVDAADDVWSLCVVLYEMITGQRPFAGDGAGEMAACIQRQRIRPAGAEAGPMGRTGASSVSQLIAFVVSILTAGRSARPATARAFADALGALREL